MAGPTKRPGSRLLLALALACSAVAALYGGARVGDAIAGALGIASVPVRLLVKVLLMAAALPAGFYLVERFFLEKAARRSKEQGPKVQGRS